jgi:hypothetical protein
MSKEKKKTSFQHISILAAFLLGFAIICTYFGPSLRWKQVSLPGKPEICPHMRIPYFDYANLQFDESSLISRFNKTRRLYQNAYLKIYVYHMHKAGGSTICHFFKTSNLSVSTENNCNGNDELKTIVLEEHYMLFDILAERKLDVVFNERSMNPNPMQIESFLYLTTVRDPLARILSEMMHAWKQHLRFDEHGRLLDIPHWVRKWGEKYRPDFESKSLVGWPIAAENLLADAIKRLNQFTFVIPTENLSVGLPMVQQYLGISVPHNSSEVIGLKTNAEHQVQWLKNQDPDLYATLQRENCNDIALHQYAQQLFNSQRSACLKLLN